MSVRTLPLIGGVLAFVVAALVLGGAWNVGLQRETITVIAFASLLVAVSAIFRRKDVREQGATPDPERRQHVPVPGSSLTAAADEFRSRGESTFSATNRVADGLYEGAIAVLTRFRGLSPAEAREHVEDGTWTDDPHAAAFLSPTVEQPSKSIRQRLSNRIVRNVSYREGVRHTASAIANVGYSTTSTEAGAGTEHDGEVRLRQYENEPVDDPVTRTTRETVDGIVERMSRQTGHWVGIGIVSLTAIGVGAFAESAAVIMAGAVGIGYAAFSHAMDPPTPDVTVERSLSVTTPEPGDDVDVTVTITNESARLLPDLRLIDGVPTGLPVTEGAARIGTSLRPGESVTLEYTITALNGRHSFDPALVFTRDLSRSTEREFLLESETTVVCEPVLRPLASNVPLRTTAATFSGRLTTTDGGAGTQFHSVREYRKSDPLNRIDWNRHARTGELATLQFHEERAARVLVLVDARKACYLAPESNTTHAVDRSVGAAGRIAASLLADGDSVGLAGIGPYYDRSDDESPEPCWLLPSSGNHHRVRYQQLLATHAQFSSTQPATECLWSPQLRKVHRRLSSETQIVLLTPLCDRTSSHIVKWLDARGHAVTVVSPDPTAERTVGQQLLRVSRRVRQFDLQRVGVPVVDWPHDDSIDEVFARIAAAGGAGSGLGGGR